MHLALRRNAIWLQDEREQIHWIDIDQPTVLHTLAFPRHSLLSVSHGVAFFTHDADPTQALIYSVDAGYAARVTLPAGFRVKNAQAHSASFFFAYGDTEVSNIAAVTLDAAQTPPPLPTLPDVESVPRACVRTLATVQRAGRQGCFLLGLGRDLSTLGGGDGEHAASGGGAFGPVLVAGARLWRLEA